MNESYFEKGPAQISLKFYVALLTTGLYLLLRIEFGGDFLVVGASTVKR